MTDTATTSTMTTSHAGNHDQHDPDHDHDHDHKNVTVPRKNRKMRLLASSSDISSNHSSNISDSKDDDDYDDDNDSNVEFGLMVTMEEGRCQFHLTGDANFRMVHPNVYAPSTLQHVLLLGGGGSGVAVFCGQDPKLGNLVMKHGGSKDLQELFALATIADELKRRGSVLGQPTAALDMQRRLPEFKSIYISPNHIMDKGKELWNHLRKLMKDWNLNELPHDNEDNNNNSCEDADTHSNHQRRRYAIKLDDEHCVFNVGMSIRLYEWAEDEPFRVLLDTKSKYPSLALVLPKDSTDFANSKTVQVKGDGYDSLKTVVDGLLPIMTDRLFKFTLAQKTIGGAAPKTGNQWLYEGKLNGQILDNLISQFIQVIQHLQHLTMPEEIDVIKLIRAEVERCEDDLCNVKAHEISATADMFVGNAVLKNFHPEKGRSRFLKEMSAKFREGSLILTPDEVVPADHLGHLLRPGALMSDTFEGTPMEPTVLQPHQHFWRNLLGRAVDTRKSMSPTALQRIWTCGLTDAGIHNLFVTENDLFLFDLGEPQLQSLPGFLTKFLFSFFHTLGMEEDGQGSWVRRFDVQGEKLALTKETTELLPKAYDAFETCLDRIIEELLDGDGDLRWLLIQYVTLQLLSDTAFCLQRWEMKGGGRTRDHNHNKGIEKWLWRALWDVYVAFDINTQDSWARFEVEHPHYLLSFGSGCTSSLESSLTSTISKLKESLRLSVDGNNDNLFDFPADTCAGEGLETQT
jgi:hypothetical protein